MLSRAKNQVSQPQLKRHKPKKNKHVKTTLTTNLIPDSGRVSVWWCEQGSASKLPTLLCFLFSASEVASPLELAAPHAASTSVLLLFFFASFCSVTNFAGLSTCFLSVLLSEWCSGERCTVLLSTEFCRWTFDTISGVLSLLLHRFFLDFFLFKVLTSVKKPISVNKMTNGTIYTRDVVSVSTSRSRDGLETHFPNVSVSSRASGSRLQVTIFSLEAN